jgi:hypothetical protein
MNTTKSNTLADSSEDSENPSRIGIYYVPDQELTNPLAERTYKQKAVWTPEGWNPDSEGEIIKDVSEHGPSELTAEWIRKRFESRNYLVGRREEVPGKVEMQEPTVPAVDLGYEAKLRPEAGLGYGDERPIGSMDSQPSASLRHTVERGLGRFAVVLDASSYRELEQRLVNDYFVEYGTRIAFLAYAFVFLYFGFLKVQALFTGFSTPVRSEVANLVTILGLPRFGITLTMVMAFIGIYEMSVGATFALKKLRLTIPLFLTHQAVTLVSLVIARTFYFQEPFLFGVPWLFDSFAAYILKNTIFIGGFLVLVAVELGDKNPKPTIGTLEGAPGGT